ncbi:MAG: hypothetical protein A2015_00595 [Spirochaetes bacterium GWF1_31_7]|nr:MAG: hypothetical protein A2Y30_03915 [Spirochaetes bacterium GWE1_32_154]OHD45171.1 MAG: hypothetical protein A2Y29_15980 [Spirochaetes bacterium GWE2_31_10]OHD51081.1 MAG: hypothetical protein A2015_00595 [Spirochaetes bacterium GWF1_31_7]OHD80594.1 MAG: hypothetical protein A2355_07675 [Spirochaetes bacterium RIFOXYB1_FULL_32_8]HBD94806.1 hypothetical protein [Spirochaetia bacterium]
MQRKKTTIILIIIILSIFSTFSDKFKEHSIKDGDNLYRIARQYNIPVTELCKVNNINQNSVLKKGAVLKVPNTTTSSALQKYTVQKGDNLFRIGLKYNITVDKLCKINAFDESVNLYPGKIIQVPANDDDKKTIYKSSDTVIHPVKKENSVRPVVVQSYFYHLMQKGETLYQLSKKYKTEIRVIQAANNLTEKTVLMPGLRLKIPQGSTRKFIDYSLPLAGRVVPYVKSHYRGVVVFSDKENAVVTSVDDGVVSYIDMRSGYGLIVFIKHANGLVSTYSGFSEIYLKKDMVVKSGDPIGKPGVISKQSDPAILFSLQDGSRALSFDMAAGKFYK